ncbi:hypothetical protein PFISCL1PPCAC_19013, partial [Pristionchus fissidentatus]
KEKIRELTTVHDSSKYCCTRCRHHGTFMLKKFHVSCPYIFCTCELCSLNAQRRKIDKELRAYRQLHENLNCDLNLS